MSAMAAAQQHYGHSFVMSSASPTDDDWDGNIVLYDMEEPNRERKVEGGEQDVTLSAADADGSHDCRISESLERITS